MVAADNNKFRALPSVDKILAAKESRALAETYSHGALVTLARDSLQAAREEISSGRPAPSLQTLVEEIESRAKALWQPSPRQVINATGVIIHTNLGRAPLSEEACPEPQCRQQPAIPTLKSTSKRASAGAGTLPSSPSSPVSPAPSLPLLLTTTPLPSTLSSASWPLDRDVIVSRGEAVEIGGGVRVPDIMKASGARLVEVGTTNRTYLSDYRNAITENTALLLKVHTSNFKVIGFTEAPYTRDLSVPRSRVRHPSRPRRRKRMSGRHPAIRPLRRADTPGQHLSRRRPRRLLRRQAPRWPPGRNNCRSKRPRLSTLPPPPRPRRPHRQDDHGLPHRHPCALLERRTPGEGACLAHDFHAL